MCTNRRKRHQSGFTLIELIIFIVVVSIGVAGILLVMDTVVKSSADPLVHKQAMALADSIMEEILQKEFQDPDGLPNVVESGRDTYDDVDDFNNNGAVFAPLLTALPGYTVTVLITPSAPLGGVTATMVTVTVGKGADTVTMTGYRTCDKTTCP